MLLRPFVPALTGAALLAMLTRPFLILLRRHFKNRNLVATIAVFCVTLCILAPVGLALHAIIRRILVVTLFLRSPAFQDSILGAFTSLQDLLQAHLSLGQSIDLTQFLNRGVSFITSTFLSLIGGSAAAATQIVVMLFLLFFWYRDEELFRIKVQSLMPFSQLEKRFLLRRVQVSVRASVTGRLIVSAVQGLLAWFAFLALGIPGASMLANCTSVCALIPAFGAYVVWVPVLIYLLLIHAWFKALALLFIGAVVLSTIDNILFPLIVGAKSHMETAQMFLSVFGGLWLFGISGLVLGPLLWVAAEAFLAIWRRRTGHIVR